MGRPLNKTKFGNPLTDGPQLIITADLGVGAESCWVVDQPGSRTYTLSSVAGGATPLRTGRARLQEATITAPGQANLTVLPFDGPVGVGATASLVYGIGSIFTPPAVPLVPITSGTGYFIGDTVTPLGGVFSIPAVYTVTLTTTGGGPGGIVTLSLTTPGAYTVPSPSDGFVPGVFTPLATLTGAGSGADIATIEWDTIGVTVTSGGSGYVSPPAVLAVGLLVSGSYSASLSGDAVSSISVSSPGFFFQGPTAAPITPSLCVGAPAVEMELARTVNQHQIKTFDGRTYKWELGVTAPTNGVEIDVPFA